MRGVQQAAAVQKEKASEDANVRVRVPHYPVYSKVRHLLSVWPGRLRKQVIGLHTTLWDQRGTPQKPVDWTDPATWIPERLAGDDLDLAHAVWNLSKGAVNPRHTRYHFQLAENYDLLRIDGHGVLELTEAGRDFREHPGGETEAVVDEGEGLIKLLSMVANHGSVWRKDLVKEWGEYLARCGSPFRSKYTIPQTMSFRLKNLLERGLVEKRGHTYSVTPGGLAYLQKTRGSSGDDSQALEPEPLPQATRPAASPSLPSPSPGLVRSLNGRRRSGFAIDYATCSTKWTRFASSTSSSGCWRRWTTKTWRSPLLRETAASTWWRTLSWASRRSERWCRSAPPYLLPCGTRPFPLFAYVVPH